MPTERQDINYGAQPNDGTGDPLRVAFIKTDDNFEAIWAAGPVGSNVVITDTTISTVSTNGSLVLKPNGVGIIRTDSTVQPRYNDTYNLGTANLRYRTLYVGSGGANILGNLQVSGSTEFSGDVIFPANVTVGGNLTVEGDIIQIGNIVTDTLTIQLANTAANAAQANGAGITVGAADDTATLLYDSGNNVWTTNIGIAVNGALSGTALFVSDATVYGNIEAVIGNYTGNVTADYFIGNGSQLTGLPENYANANAVNYAESGWAGNIIPAGNGVYSLGNATNYWSNLWVANNTIYIGGVPLGVSGNVLTVDGQPVLSNDSDSSILTTGDITANSFIGDGSQLTGLPEQYGNANVAAYLPTYDGNISAVDISARGTVVGGNLYLRNGSMRLADGATEPSIGIRADGGIGSAGISIPNNDTANTVALTVENLLGNVQIQSAGLDGWLFRNDNALVLPWQGNIIGTTPNNSGSMQWVGNSSGDLNGYTTLRLVPDDTLVANDQYLVIDPTAPSHIHIRAGGTQDSSQAELFLGGETNYVRVTDSSGVRLQNQTRDNTDYNYSDPGTFTTGTWYESAGTYFVQYTTSDAELINVSFQFNNDNENTLVVTYNGGADTAELTSAGSVSNLGGGVYRVSVNQAPPASPTVISAFEYTIWSTNTNSARLENDDFTVDVTDDVRITGADLFRLVNESSTESIQIITNDNAAARFWDFGADGNLSLPAGGYVSVSGGLIGSGASPAPTISGFSTISALGNITGGNIGTSGNITAGNILTNNYFYANGAPFVSSDYGNSNVVTLLSAFGSNTISTTGNVAAGNFTGSGTNVDIVAGSYDWTFDNLGNLTLPGNTFAVNYANGTAVTLGGDYSNANVVSLLSNFGSNTISTTGNISATRLQNDANLVIRSNVAGTLRNWTFDTLGDLNLPFGGNIVGSGGISANTGTFTGNITADVLISSNSIFGNPDLILGNVANAAATKTRIATFGASSYIQTGNGTVGSTGNIVFAPYLDSTEKVVIDTATGNVTAQNFVGNISITGNVTGTSANVDLVAGAYEWTFDNTGNLTLPGNTFAVNYANGSPIDVVTRFEGTWTAPTGNSTQSFTVDANDTYYMWVVSNIPNGIITWNATATITNTNVPVVGVQYAWVYDGAGTPIDFTSIPNQFVGTANTIVRSNVSPSVTTNRFDFGINNTSGSPQTVRYGWIRIS